MTFLLILDGAEEDALLDGGSPLDAADMPHLHTLVARGISGQAEFFLPGREIDSLTCILTMLGVPAGEIPPSRAPLEALGAGIRVGKGDMVCRCNLVSHQSGRLVSFNGTGLSREQMRAFSAAAAGLAPPGMRLLHLSDYRNLLVMENTALPDRTADAPPPHQSIGRPLADLLAGVGADGRLSRFVAASGKIRPGYQLYPWGAGRAAALPSYKSLTGRSAACICGTELMAGIGKALGMVVRVPCGATGDGDTDLHAKAAAALALSKGFDTLILHVNGTDEFAHRRNREGKIRFLERIDRELLGPVLGGIGRNARFLVTSDHGTSSRTGRHERIPVRWFCADFHREKRMFTPPEIEKRRFDRLLREEMG